MLFADRWDVCKYGKIVNHQLYGREDLLDDHVGGDWRTMPDCLDIITYCLEFDVNSRPFSSLPWFVVLALPRYQRHKESFRALLKR